MQPNVIVRNADAQNRALALCRGEYQRGLILGRHALSGADLEGKARSYGGRYLRSRQALLARLDAAGVPHNEVIGKRGKRILVLG